MRLDVRRSFVCCIHARHWQLTGNCPEPRRAYYHPRWAAEPTGTGRHQLAADVWGPCSDRDAGRLRLALRLAVGVRSAPGRTQCRSGCRWPFHQCARGPATAQTKQASLSHTRRALCGEEPAGPGPGPCCQPGRPGSRRWRLPVTVALHSAAAPPRHPSRSRPRVGSFTLADPGPDPRRPARTLPTGMARALASGLPLASPSCCLR
jgi:hypothetical protein